MPAMGALNMAPTPPAQPEDSGGQAEEAAVAAEESVDQAGEAGDDAAAVAEEDMDESAAVVTATPGGADEG